MIQTNAAERWYAVHTKPNQEARAESNLRAWGLPTLLPRTQGRRQRRVNQQSAALVPLFPRYLFSRFDPTAMLHSVSFTRGVDRVVSLGGAPLPVDDEIVTEIESRMDADGIVCTEPDLVPGDVVRIEEGVLRGFSGVFQCDLQAADRVRLLLTTMGAPVHLVVNRAALSKA